MLWLLLVVARVSQVMCLVDPETVDMLTPLRQIGEACGYESCPTVREDKLNVHIVPHSHAELGYTASFQQHYTGEDDIYEKSKINIQRILDSVLAELWMNPNRKFTISDLAYFFHWWKRRDTTVHRMVYTLIRQGRLHFVGGGWSMSDEATTSYQAIIDHYTFALRKLNETFLECGRPLVGWQADVFGHSKEFTSLLARMSFDGLFINPISFDDELPRCTRKALEVLWRGNDDLGRETDLFTHKLFDGYWSPPGFCFGSLCQDPLLITSDSVMSNVHERVDEFIHSVLVRQAPNYATRHALVVMGQRFGYFDAPLWFRNIDVLIEYANNKSYSDNLGLHFYYSTPACYLQAVHYAGPTLEIKQDDFLPFAYDEQNYATGMYSSRPTLKYIIREGFRYLVMAKQLQVIARLNNDQLIEDLTWINGVMQDHNIVTGALRLPVKHYYVKKLHHAIQRATGFLKDAFNKLRNSPMPHQTYYRCQFNISSCASTNSPTYSILVYNPLAWPVSVPVRLPTVRRLYYVFGPNGETIKAALMKIPRPVLDLPQRYTTANLELVFIADDVPPMGYRSYFIISSKAFEKTQQSTSKHKRSVELFDDKINKDERISNSKQKRQNQFVLESGDLLHLLEKPFLVKNASELNDTDLLENKYYRTNHTTETVGFSSNIQDNVIIEEKLSDKNYKTTDINLRENKQNLNNDKTTESIKFFGNVTSKSLPEINTTIRKAVIFKENNNIMTDTDLLGDNHYNRKSFNSVYDYSDNIENDTVTISNNIKHNFLIDKGTDSDFDTFPVTNKYTKPAVQITRTTLSSKLINDKNGESNGTISLAVQITRTTPSSKLINDENDENDESIETISNKDNQESFNTTVQINASNDYPTSKSENPVSNFTSVITAPISEAITTKIPYFHITTEHNTLNSTLISDEIPIATVEDANSNEDLGEETNSEDLNYTSGTEVTSDINEEATTIMSVNIELNYINSSYSLRNLNHDIRPTKKNIISTEINVSNENEELSKDINVEVTTSSFEALDLRPTIKTASITVQNVNVNEKVSQDTTEEDSATLSDKEVATTSIFESQYFKSRPTEINSNTGAIFNENTIIYRRKNSKLNIDDSYNEVYNKTVDALVDSTSTFLDDIFQNSGIPILEDASTKKYDLNTFDEYFPHIEDLKSKNDNDDKLLEVTDTKNSTEFDDSSKMNIFLEDTSMKKYDLNNYDKYFPNKEDTTSKNDNDDKSVEVTDKKKSTQFNDSSKVKFNNFDKSNISSDGKMSKVYEGRKFKEPIFSYKRIYDYVPSNDLFIKNKYIKVKIDSESRKISKISLSNGIDIPLDIQFYYYISDDPYISKGKPRRSPGAYFFRPMDYNEIPIIDVVDTKVYKTDVVEEIHCKYSNWTSFVARIYKESTVVEIDWVVGPIPIDDGFGKDVFVRYMSDLENDGAFYTDSNGRQTIKRLKFRRATFVPANLNADGNYYPVTSKIYIEDKKRNIRLSIFNDRSQGGTSLHDGEIDLMVHRRILTDDSGVQFYLNDTFTGDNRVEEGIRVRGKHYIYVTKANYRPNKVFEKKFAKEIELSPQFFITKTDLASPDIWGKMRNEFTPIKKNLPIGVHILTVQKLEEDTLLVRLENYLEKDDVVKSGIKRVFIKDIFKKLRIINIKETTLAGNMWLKDFVPLKWQKKGKFLKSFNSYYGGDEAPVFDEKEEMDGSEDVGVNDGVLLTPQQIRTFIVQYRYVSEKNKTRN